MDAETVLRLLILEPPLFNLGDLDEKDRDTFYELNKMLVPSSWGRK